jgi:transcription termination/antitermination protein NusG
MPELALNRWFAVQVRPRSEKLVGSLLDHKGYEVYLPLYTSPRPRAGDGERELPLLPGYLFCRSVASARGLVVTTPGIVRILGYGRRPQPIEDSQIVMLKTVVASGLKIQPWPKLELGEYVEIREGPLRGLRGIVKRWRSDSKLIISIEMMQRSVAVEMPPTSVYPAQGLQRAAELSRGEGRRPRLRRAG